MQEYFAYFYALFDGYKYSRDEVFEKLAKENVHARKYFYPLTNEFECYQDYSTADVRKHLLQNISLIMYCVCQCMRIWIWKM